MPQHTSLLKCYLENKEKDVIVKIKYTDGFKQKIIYFNTKIPDLFLLI